MDRHSATEYFSTQSPHDPQDFQTILVAAGRRMETRVACKRVATNELRQSLPGIVDLRGNHHVPICGGKHAIQCRRRRVMPRLLRDFLAAGQGVTLHGVFVHRPGAVVQRQVDMLTAPGFYAAKQCRADRGDGIRSGLTCRQARCAATAALLPATRPSP